MTHYFVTPEGEQRRREVTATIWDTDMAFTTANGVFSGSRLDPGTAVLFRETEPPSTARRLADLGCGFGPIAVALAVHCPEAVVDAVDVNSRALELTALNAERAGVANRVRVLTPGQAQSLSEGGYDEIWSNPPIRIGKEALHQLLLDWLPRLAPGGRMVLVVARNLGADSLQRWLDDQGHPCHRLASAKGYRVLEVAPLPE